MNTFFLFLNTVMRFASRAFPRVMHWLPLIGIGFIPTGCDEHSSMSDPYYHYPHNYCAWCSTSRVTDITTTTAICGGETNEGYPGTPITARGVCWSTRRDPTISDSKTLDGAGEGAFTSSLTGLQPATVYFVRAYVIDSSGVSYAYPPIMFSTADTSHGMTTDIDGNVYHFILIGSQYWMLENLRVTRLRTGEALQYREDGHEWSSLQAPGYAWYENDKASYGKTYGALYNWHAVNSGVLAPEGWRVPTDDDWATLSDFLGGDYDAGGKLKETKTAHWQSPNTDADNTSGFTALPGGTCNAAGVFAGLGLGGWWWSSTATDKSNAWHVGLQNEDGMFRRTASLFGGYGFSVRCVKDN